jgi:putative aminopeptidase FrvX
MLDSTDLIRELTAVLGPAGNEEAVSAAVSAYAESLGYACHLDAKGNLLIPLPTGGEPLTAPRIVVTAHLDELGLMVSQIEPDGSVRVIPMGGLYPWKWGEQPVEIMAQPEPVPGVVSFGCIHTNSPLSVAQHARNEPLTWEQAYIFTGLLPEELQERGVRPGVRVALARDRRTVREIGPYLCGYFLDDRADLAAMLLALEKLRGAVFPQGVLFAATVSEEVGGEGALYLLQRYRPDICLALEIGPSVPESRFFPDAQPTIWVNDSFAAMSARDVEEMHRLCAKLQLTPHWQALSRGGSDASCAAARGLTARPITLGLPVENSHGYEIMHRDAPRVLAHLLAAYLQQM